jgi:hypothetical protein
MAQQAQEINHRLVPWVNGVKWKYANGLEGVQT